MTAGASFAKGLKGLNPMRKASIERKTRETEISVSVDLDGTGAYDIKSGIGFLDHMLESFAKHSSIDLKLKAKGDTHIDFHHTTEDTAIVIGLAIVPDAGWATARDRGQAPTQKPSFAPSTRDGRVTHGTGAQWTTSTLPKRWPTSSRRT